jgi:hypothetical protein
MVDDGRKGEIGWKKEEEAGVGEDEARKGTAYKKWEMRSEKSELTSEENAQSKPNFSL